MTLKTYIGIVAILITGLLAFVWLWRGHGHSPEELVGRVSHGAPTGISAIKTRADVPAQPIDDAPTAEPVPPTPDVAQPAILGRVTDSHGAALAGASVAAYHPDRGAFRATTDGFGHFAIGPLEVLSYRVSGAHPGYNEIILDSVETGTTPVDLILTPASRATGRVENAAGNPVTDFDVVYLNEGRGDEVWWREAVARASTPWTAVSHPEGRFEVDNVASGVPFSIGARAPGYEPAFVTVAPVQPGKTTEAVRIQLKGEARVAGRVLSPDRVPVANATIHQRPDPDSPVLATCDGAGNFELAGLGDAPLELTATADNFLAATVSVQPRRDQTVRTEIVMGLGGSVQGTLRKGDLPAPEQTVVVSRQSPPKLRKEVVTDAHGHYHIAGVAPGEVNVLAEWTGSDSGSVSRNMHQLAWVKSGQTTVVDFVFPDTGAVLEGWVTANGAPLPSAELRGTVYLGESRSYFSGTTGEDGFYRIEGITPGPASLEVTKATDDSDLKQNIEFTLVAGQTLQQNIDFDLTTRIHGRVLGLASGDVGQVMVLDDGAEVDLSTMEGVLALEAASNGGCDIAEDGTFTIEGLQSGRYTVVAVVFSGASDTSDDVFDTTRVATQQATVSGPGQTVITLTLNP